MRYFALVLFLPLLGCTEKAASLIGIRAQDEACAQISDCKAGLRCDDNICVPLSEPATTGRAGTACTQSSECNRGLCCGNQGVCREDRPDFEDGTCGYEIGDLCGTDADCDVGLVCAGTGECAMPGGPNQTPVGGACQDFSDCKRPLICGAVNTCDKPPFFAGVSCVRSEEEIGAFRGYFEIPRGGMPLDEFYRQPFPSDVRRANGRIDLTGHPSPGSVGGVDFSDLYLAAISADNDGFGLSQPVFMQFSDIIDRSTLTATAAVPTVMLIDIDVMSPERGQRVPIQISYNEDRALFVCSNALAVAPIDGFALRPRTTYAVIVTRELRDVRGDPPLQDRDFELVLGATRPADDADAARAWDAYAPLRAYLTDEGIAPDTIAIAAVYTTGDPAETAPKLRAAVRAAAAPELRQITRCRQGATSPCQEGQVRGCVAGDASFIQIHAKMTNPVLQEGTRPYATPGASMTEGLLARDAGGDVVARGTEEICVAITIPTGGPMPAGGWPIVIYGHGTGGDFTSGLDQVAKDLSEVRDANNAVIARMATISYDGAMHGPRQNLPAGARGDPGRLFFNAANPRAARDNVLQGAADLHNLVRLVETLQLSAADTGAAAASFNPDRILYYGHSQGTVVGAPFVAEEPNLRAAVFTGAGAEIGLTMIYKRKPNDISTITRVLFGDQSVTRLHPMIGLMSLFFGPSDAIPFGRAIATERPAAKGRADFLQVYGLEDGFVPEVTEQALVRAGEYPIVGRVLRPIAGVPSVEGRVTGNINGSSVGTLQYRPPVAGGRPEYDGHFVGTRDVEAREAIARFLATAAAGDAPAVIER